VNPRLCVATRKGLFIYRRAGAAGGWDVESVSFLGDSVSLVLHDPRDGALYAALELGHFGVKLHKSLDGGRSWQACGKPSYPPLPEGAEPEKNEMGQVIPHNVEKIWALAFGHPERPGQLWCGTIPGGLFESRDGGESWQLNRPLWEHPKRKSWFGGGADLPGIHSILVHPERPDNIIVGVSCGGVWQSDDAGQSWRSAARGMTADYMPPEGAEREEVQDPHSISRCKAAPEVLWAQHHNGIFRSDDGASSWRRIVAEPSSFGFAVCVHPSDPERAWFVPAVKDERRVPVDAKVIVTRTRDGGRSFDTLSQGLPAEHAYDLTYRHAFDIDESGEQLAFGSTTGSLWFSDDQGEAWHLLNAHLPPIYALRFA
jgi:photosystem II stability/assembly factor-like uncharacterized protein